LLWWAAWLTWSYIYLHFTVSFPHPTMYPVALSPHFAEFSGWNTQLEPTIMFTFALLHVCACNNIAFYSQQLSTQFYAQSAVDLCIGPLVVVLRHV
jgi:hypothetical protein